MTVPTLPTAPLNPWKSIWLKPRETFRQVLEAPRDRKREIVMLAAAGAANALGNILWDEKHDAVMGTSARFFIIPLALLIGAGLTVLLAKLASHVSSWLFRTFFKGTATPEDLYVVYAWGSIPAVLILPPTLFFILAFPTSTSIEGAGALAALPFSLFVIVLSLWQVAISFFGLAEAQRWSFWKAVINTLIIGLVTGIALAIIIVPIVMLTAGKT